MLNVSAVKTNDLINPVGIEGPGWFSWILESDRSQVKQKAYELELGEDSDFCHVLYQSGWVAGEESAHVRIPELKLQSCSKYYVRVRVRDGQEESSYSDPAFFVTGILHKSEWQAQFITAETPEEKNQSAGTYLRKEIQAEDGIESAYLCATALGLYHVYINGKKVGEDELTPGWTSYKKHLCYQTYDVTEDIIAGTNTLGAMVGAGWYKGKMGFLHLRNNYGEQSALLMQLTVRYKDGRTERFVTDDSWSGHAGPVVFSEIYDGELYDARLEIPGWNENGLDEIGWHTVHTVPFPMEVLTPQAGSKARVMEQLPAERIFHTPEGDTVIDFGQNLTGWIHFRVCGNPGDEVVLQCFETLDAAGNVYTANLRTAKSQIRFICKGGEEVYHPHFTFQGFRYARILQWPGQVCLEHVTAHVVYSEMEMRGHFTCSNPLVNQLHHNIVWSMKGNFLDVPTDCPQRDERMGWTGDAQIFCRTACFLMDTDTFFRKWLKDVAADQTEEGGVPHVVPDIVTGKEINDWLLSRGTHSAAAWADVAVINPWTMYLMYGDRDILEEQYDSMKQWITFMRDHAVDGIWNYKLQFGDWVALDAEEGSYFGATPNDLTCTAYYAYSTGLFAKIAGILGRNEDAKEFGRLYDAVVLKFRDTFFREDGTMTAMTQTAHIVALYFGLVPEQWREQTARRLTELLKAEGGHLVTGFVGTPYFCHALSQNGYGREAYELLLKEDFPSWLYQVKKGATTIWEHWDGLKPDGTMWSPDMNSFNHYAYGAVGEWLYRVVLGIEANEHDPGYHHMIISPQTADVLDYAEGHYDSVYGRIGVRWEKNGTQAGRKLSVTVPHNTSASIRLEKGAVPVQAEGLEFREESGIWTAETGSGRWEILYEIHELCI